MLSDDGWIRRRYKGMNGRGRETMGEKRLFWRGEGGRCSDLKRRAFERNAVVEITKQEWKRTAGTIGKQQRRPGRRRPGTPVIRQAD
jgi:hypothetical protein